MDRKKSLVSLLVVILAGIGLSAGILDSRLYAVIAAAAFMTTLVGPRRFRELIARRRRQALAPGKPIAEPEGGWLNISQDSIELNAEPPDLLAGRLGLEAAVGCASRQPGPWLLQWLSSADPSDKHWDDHLRRGLFHLLRDGNERSWRFLQVTGLLDEWLPLLGAAAEARKRDRFDLEPGGDLRWSLLQGLRDLVQGSEQEVSGGVPEKFAALWKRVEHHDLLYLSALLADAFDGDSAALQAEKLARSIGLDDESIGIVGFLVAEHRLIPAAARRLYALGEDSVLELAAHIESSDRVDALAVLAFAGGSKEDWEQQRLHELIDLIQAALALGRGGGTVNGDLFEQRGAEIRSSLEHLPQTRVDDHLRSAPRRYLVAHGPEVVARHLEMTQTPLSRHELRLQADSAAGEGSWTVHVVTKDRRGLLAAIAQAFCSADVSVNEAFASTWRNGTAIDVFHVTAPEGVDWQQIYSSILACLEAGGDNGAISEPVRGTVEIDNMASPWHTILEIRALDRRGLLHRVAAALSKAGLQIDMAVVHTQGDVAVDIFYATGGSGGKLNAVEQERLRQALAGVRARRWWRPCRAKQRV